MNTITPYDDWKSLSVAVKLVNNLLSSCSTHNPTLFRVFLHLYDQRESIRTY